MARLEAFHPLRRVEGGGSVGILVVQHPELEPGLGVVRRRQRQEGDRPGDVAPVGQAGRQLALDLAVIGVALESPTQIPLGNFVVAGASGDAPGDTQGQRVPGIQRERLLGSRQGGGEVSLRGQALSVARERVGGGRLSERGIPDHRMVGKFTRTAEIERPPAAGGAARGPQSVRRTGRTADGRSAGCSW